VGYEIHGTSFIQAALEGNQLAIELMLVMPEYYVQWHTRNLHPATVQRFRAIVDRGVFIPERENWLDRVQSFVFSHIRERPFTSLLLGNSLFFNLYLFVSIKPTLASAATSNKDVL
jgi:hypothetical protein